MHGHSGCRVLQPSRGATTPAAAAASQALQRQYGFLYLLTFEA